MEAGVSLLKGASLEASFARLGNDIEKTPWRSQRNFLDYKVEVMSSYLLQINVIRPAGIFFHNRRNMDGIHNIFPTF